MRPLSIREQPPCDAPLGQRGEISCVVDSVNFRPGRVKVAQLEANNGGSLGSRHTYLGNLGNQAPCQRLLRKRTRTKNSSPEFLTKRELL